MDFLQEQADLRKSRPPRESSEKWTFLSLAFYNAPSRTLSVTIQKMIPAVSCNCLAKGGQTDAAISLGEGLRAKLRGQASGGSRKIVLNAVCCCGMVFGGFLSVIGHRHWGATAALVPGGALAFTATVLPRFVEALSYAQR